MPQLVPPGSSFAQRQSFSVTRGVFVGSEAGGIRPLARIRLGVESIAVADDRLDHGARRFESLDRMVFLCQTIQDVLQTGAQHFQTPRKQIWANHSLGSITMWPFTLTYRRDLESPVELTVGEHVEGRKGVDPWTLLKLDPQFYWMISQSISSF